MDVVNCKYFIFPNLTKKHWYFSMFILGIILRVLVPDILKLINRKEEKQDISLNRLLTQKYFEITRNIGSSLLLGFPHFYYKFMSKSSNKKSRKNPHKINFIYNEKKSGIPNVLKIIFIISTVDIICQLLIPLKYLFEDYAFMGKILDTPYYHLYFLLFFDIFARYLFSRFILKTYFYYHHKLSFLLNIIGLIPITVVDILVKCTFKFSRNYEEGETKKFDPLFISVIALQLTLYSFEDIMNKVAFRTLSILPCTLIFYNGLCELVYFGIISLLFFVFKYNENVDIDLLFELKIFICYAPFDILRRIYLIRVIDKFSAQHMTLLKVSEAIIIYIYTNIAIPIGLREKKNTFKLGHLHFILQGIGFAFLLISTLIHNEIIIINHPKLRAKTEYYLGKDADKEQNCTMSDSFITTNNNSETNIYNDLTGSDIS
jgi:hypothetical protein